MLNYVNNIWNWDNSLLENQFIARYPYSSDAKNI